MKIHSIDQSIKCSQCRSTMLVKTCKRLMNFTSGEIFFYCYKCRARIGFLTFARWNALNRAYYENPPPPGKTEAAPPSREPREGGRRRRRDRSRGRGRGNPNTAQRQSSNRS